MIVRPASLFLLLSATPVGAHSWYDARCCSGRDCHPVPCDQLRSGTGGMLTFRPTGVQFSKENVLPSQDTQCHICTSRPESDTGYGYCAYVVQGS
ncbi:hypothetical protein [Lichenifustis flavocetrariae]|uniref:Secreted protein n=1 Tax=Lichenifustis flavocetrariae TaxID=2949735 RepID=A0AA41YWL9_9HYPH|nr:hypothetical protein [Lichenifustis flavocetrariae]MCW6508655.1 hypothetical protein [Lichenifustis flavocetrariae]